MITDNWSFYLAQQNFITRKAYDGNNNLQYVGWAQAGAADTDSSWRIMTTTYTLIAGSYYEANTGFPQDANGNPSCAFAFQWSARASYTYS